MPQKQIRCRYCKEKKSIKNFEIHQTGSKRIGKRRSECNDCRKKIHRTGTCQRKRTVAIQDYIKLQRLLYELGFALNQDDQFPSKIDIKNAYIKQIEEAVYRFENCTRCKIELKKLERYFPLCLQCAGTDNPKDLLKKQHHQKEEHDDDDHFGEEKNVEHHVEHINKNNEEDEKKEKMILPLIVKEKKNKSTKIEERDMDWYIFDIIEREDYPKCRNSIHQKDIFLRPMFTTESKMIYSKRDRKEIDMFLSVRLWCYDCKKNYFIYNPKENNNQRYETREHYINTWFQNHKDLPLKTTLLYKYMWNWANYLNQKYNANISIEDTEKTWLPVYRSKLNHVLQYFKENPSEIKKYNIPDFYNSSSTHIVQEQKF